MHICRTGRYKLIGTNTMHLTPPPPPPRWLRLLSVLRRWFCCCWLFVYCWESVIVLCFVVCYYISILVLQSSWWGRDSWLLCLICLPGVSWWLSGSSSLCHRVVCGLWVWYFLIILTYYFLLSSYEVYARKRMYLFLLFKTVKIYDQTQHRSCKCWKSQTQKTVLGLKRRIMKTW